MSLIGQETSPDSKMEIANWRLIDENILIELSAHDHLNYEFSHKAKTGPALFSLDLNWLDL